MSFIYYAGPHYLCAQCGARECALVGNIQTLCETCRRLLQKKYGHTLHIVATMRRQRLLKRAFIHRCGKEIATMILNYLCDDVGCVADTPEVWLVLMGFETQTSCHGIADWRSFIPPHCPHQLALRVGDVCVRFAKAGDEHQK